MHASQARIVLSTAGAELQARSIARRLVDERLAACVNIVGPIRSVYRWRDAVEDEPEFLLLIKTRASLLGRVERRVIELHSYEVPGGACARAERRLGGLPRMAARIDRVETGACQGARDTQTRQTRQARIGRHARDVSQGNSQDGALCARRAAAAGPAPRQAQHQREPVSALAASDQSGRERGDRPGAAALSGAAGRRLRRSRRAPLRLCRAY